jgi:hypothetical protein
MKILKQPNGLCYNWPEMQGEDRLPFVKYPAFVELKLDGELNVFHKGFLINKNQKYRYDCPITKILSWLSDDYTLWGELYYGPGKNGDLYKLLSNKESDELHYSIFDITGPHIGHKPYMERRERLLELQASNWYPHVHVINTLVAEDRQQLDSYLDVYTRAGYEGIVIKNGDEPFKTGPCNWIKIKPIQTIDCEIIMIDPVKERMEVAHLNRPVGVKLNNKYRHLVKVGNVIEIEHRGILSGNGLRHPNFRGKVVK